MPTAWSVHIKLNNKKWRTVMRQKLQQYAFLFVKEVNISCRNWQRKKNKNGTFSLTPKQADEHITSYVADAYTTASKAIRRIFCLVHAISQSVESWVRQKRANKPTFLLQISGMDGYKGKHTGIFFWKLTAEKICIFDTISLHKTIPPSGYTKQ